MIHVEVIDLVYGRAKVINCKYFKRNEAKTFLYYIQKIQKLVLFNINNSKTLAITYLIVWISYRFDFKESPLRGKVDSVLWYLRDIRNVKKTRVLIALRLSKSSNTNKNAFYQPLNILTCFKICLNLSSKQKQTHSLTFCPTYCEILYMSIPKEQLILNGNH